MTRLIIVSGPPIQLGRIFPKGRSRPSSLSPSIHPYPTMGWPGTFPSQQKAPLESTGSARKRRTPSRQDYPKSEQGEAAKEAAKAQPRAAASQSRAGGAQAAVPAGQSCWGATALTEAGAGAPARPHHKPLSALWQAGHEGAAQERCLCAGDRQAGGSVSSSKVAGLPQVRQRCCQGSGGNCSLNGSTWSSFSSACEVWEPSTSGFFS